MDPERPAAPDSVAGWPPPARSPFLNGNGEHSVAAGANQRVRTAPSPLVPEPPGAENQIVRNVAASAAHDMANLLCVMGFSLGRLGSEALSPEGAEAVGALRAEIAHLQDLASELRMAAAESGPVHTDRHTRLAAWWPGIQALLRAATGEEVIIHGRIPWGLPAVCITPQHLTQVLLNLSENAAHAIADRGCGHTGAANPALRRRGRIEISARLVGDGRIVELTVADNGPGMSPGVLAHAAERFFTTRSGRGGTGLGLATIRRLIGDAGGRVGLASVLGVGTTVTIELPARAETSAGLTEGDSGPEPGGRARQAGVSRGTRSP